MIYIIAAIKTVVIFFLVINLVPLLIWVERKGAAYIQDRRGPNRANILGIRLGGIIHSLSDVVKLLTKEDIIPSYVNKPLYLLAPMIAMFVATITMAVIPFADPIFLDSGKFLFQVTDLDVGLLYVFAVSSLGVYGVMLAGWASNNKFSLLGGLRASSQMISYEISMGLAVMGIFLISGSLKLSDIVTTQGSNPLHWNIVLQPIGFFLFLASAFAETSRLPFDLPEGEAEIVAGFHLEYSSMKFALFFMAEYAHIVVASAIITTLFFGGWHLPFITPQWIWSNTFAILRVLWLLGAVGCLLGGAALVWQYVPRKYGDLRDYEVLVFGVPGVVLGIVLLALWIALRGQVPAFDWVRQATVTGLQLATFLVKILFFCFVFIWVRWTLPRFRYDQVMKLGWKMMLPLALANLLVTAWVVLMS